jgi:hypothetical protein
MTASPAELLAETEQTLLKAFEAGNIIGFTERPMAALFVSHVRSGRGLTSDQARQAWRILQRNEAKLLAAGMTLPGAKREEPVQQVTGLAEGYTGRPVELVTRPDGRIDIRHSPMSLNEQLKLGLYAQFHPITKARPVATWSVPASPASAAGLLGLLGDLDVKMSPRVRELADAHMARLAAYERLDPGYPLPTLDQARLVRGVLRDYQVRGVDFLVHALSALLAFTMGGGKTATAIAAINQLEAKRGIIVCPNKVRGVWPREVAKWSARSWHIVDGKRDAKIKGRKRQDLSVVDRVHETEQILFDCTCGAQCHVAVWNYEMVNHAPASTWRPAEMLDFVVYDEIQRLKSATGGMSKAFGEWVGFTRARYGLSGTPMPQFPWDIFGVYRALDPGIFGTLLKLFEGEFVVKKTTKDGKDYPVNIRADKRSEFAARVHSIMYRPKIKLKLPGRQDVHRFVDLEPKARRAYDTLDKELWADLSPFADDWTEGDETLTPKNFLSRQVRLAQLTGGTVPDDVFVIEKGEAGSKYRISHAKEDELVEFSHKAKGDGTYNITGGILDEIGCVPGHPGGPEPVCVYVQYTDDLDVIKGIAKKAGLRYGEISGRRGDGLTDTAELAPDVDLCGIQIQAGGTGVDLTRSRYAIWYSKGYSLGDYDQARARQDRPGQTRPVVNIHLVARDTIDEDIDTALIKRRSLIELCCERRGIDPRAFGVEQDYVPPAPEFPDGNDREGGAVVLPIDEFGHDVMRGRKAHTEHDAEGRVVADKETLKLFDLEDF